MSRLSDITAAVEILRPLSPEDRALAMEEVSARRRRRRRGGRKKASVAAKKSKSTPETEDEAPTHKKKKKHKKTKHASQTRTPSMIAGDGESE